MVAKTKIRSESNWVRRSNPAVSADQLSFKLLIWVKVCMWGPERWRTFVEQGEVGRKPDGGLKMLWRANLFSDFTKAAKDSSSHLVAGFIRSFSQDSCRLLMGSGGKANDWRIRWRNVVDRLSNSKFLRFPFCLVWKRNFGQRTVSGLARVSLAGDGE